MIKIFSTNQVKELDQYTIQYEPIESIDLVERAATMFVHEFCRHYSKQIRIIIFAGQGNNGADALAIARLLTEESYRVETYLFNPTEHLSEDCERNKRRLLDMERVDFTEITQDFEPPELSEHDVVIDGLFGSGLNRPLTGGFASVVSYINQSEAKIVAIDIPSGLFGEDNVWMIWAEEGASRGDVKRSKGTNGDTYNYRCVRNLGISLANIGKEPDDYVTLDKGTHTVWIQGNFGWQRQTFDEYIIDVSRLNNNTLRTATAEQVLETHTERANLNRPARAFAVITDRRYSVGSSWDDDVQTESNGDPCPRGYRLPNQRELLLLTMYFGYNRPDEAYDNLFDGVNATNIFVCKTNFGFSGYTYTGKTGGTYSNRPGFGYEIAAGDASNSTFLLLNSSSGTFYARCVRDVTN